MANNRKYTKQQLQNMSVEQLRELDNSLNVRQPRRNEQPLPPPQPRRNEQPLPPPQPLNHSRKKRTDKIKLQYGGMIKGEMCLEGTKIKYTGKAVNIGGTHYTTKGGTLEGNSKKLYNC